MNYFPFGCLINIELKPLTEYPNPPNFKDYVDKFPLDKENHVYVIYNRPFSGDQNIYHFSGENYKWDNLVFNTGFHTAGITNSELLIFKKPE